MRKAALTIGSLLAFGSCAPAFSGVAATTDGVVGVSIGADLTVDAGFGDQGYTVVNYNDDGGTWDEAVRVIPAQGDGFWLVGFHRTDASADRLAISKLDADGRLDPSFGTEGKTLIDTGISYVRDAIRVDDRFYVVGMHLLTSQGPGVMAVACVDVDGAYCPGFGDEHGTVTIALNAPGFTSEALRVLHRDGKLYAIGNTDPGGERGHSSAMAVAKLDASTGALDATFGDGSGPLPGTVVFDPDVYPDGNDFAYATAFAGDGMILVGGAAQNNDNQGSDGYVLAFDPANGALDTSFGTDGYTFFSFDTGVHFDQVLVRKIHVFDDGRILLAGEANHDDEFFNTLTDVLLASLQPDGTPTLGFGVGGATHVNVGLNAVVQDMGVRSNGDIVVSMSANGINPNPYTPATQQSIAQFDASGNGPTATVSIEYPSQVTPQGAPTSLYVDASDRVLVAGFRLWDFNFPVPDSDHTLTRLVRDGIFADGFEP
ncbi:hypothetical protein [Dokdonella sp.]|uniref:hypothetical protein n=1 Tax=Dokdonella sp. TaxID=2291710 RepID=UPI001B0E4DE3|nr:hypothetical protein [Dokdonella sp.]MBO9662768.1 hypothetical protein [Dokdonella sp.]